MAFIVAKRSPQGRKPKPTHTDVIERFEEMFDGLVVNYNVGDKTVRTMVKMKQFLLHELEQARREERLNTAKDINNAVKAFFSFAPLNDFIDSLLLTIEESK